MSPTSATPPVAPAAAPAAARQTEPNNTATRRLFVAATRMNEGKTTTCLGLYSALQTVYPRVGFIKPIGQRFVQVEGHQVDEDSFLLDTIFNVRVPIESMSPVTVDSKMTRRYLADPEGTLPVLIDKVCRGFDRVSWEKDFTLIEGTGHAGVGAVFDLSNARVAALLRAKVVIVSSGGIGRPIDEIALNKALFDREGVEVVGAVLNKVAADRIEDITDYAGRGLARLGVPLLGVLPMQERLGEPNLSQVVDEIGGRWLNARSTGATERIHRFVIGAMTAKGLVDHLEPGVLLLTPGDREDVLLAVIAATGLCGRKVLSGIILTRDLMPHPKLMEMLAQTNIPVVAAPHDSFDIASRINHMTIKTQPQDVDKIPIIKRLVLEHVDLSRLLAAL